MKKFAVIVAGGSGQRMGASVPKQFLLLKGKPLLYYTLTTFLKSYNDLHIILVLPKEHFAKGTEIVEAINGMERIQLVEGGATRFHSVQNGLKHVTTNSVVFVHDGVRCMVDVDLIHHCYEQTLLNGNAIPAVAATDSIRIVTNNESKVTDRNNVRIIQTPQTFKSDILLKAFEQSYCDAFTDEATVAEAIGEKIHLVNGSYNNIKVTRPVDLLIAERILEERR